MATSFFAQDSNWYKSVQKRSIDGLASIAATVIDWKGAQRPRNSLVLASSLSRKSQKIKKDYSPSSATERRTEVR